MTPLETRLRRLAILVPALAIVAAVIGFLPGGIALSGRTFERDHTTFAGGYSVAAWALFHAFAAASVRAAPNPRRGWTWFFLALFAMFGGGLAWFVEHFTLSSEAPLWPANVVIACVGTALALSTFALPAVLLFSEREPPLAPEARVVTRLDPRA